MVLSTNAIQDDYLYDSYITGYCGYPRSGKTVRTYIDALALAEKYKKYDIKIKGNLEGNKIEYVNPIDLLDYSLEKCVLILDEAQTFLDSRNPPQMNQYLSYFISQCGHRFVFILWNAQLGSMVDKRLRELSQYIYLCENNRLEFLYTLYYRGNPNPIGEERLSKIKAKPFYKEYKTLSIIKPISMLQNDQITIEDLTKLYDNAPNKRTFTALFKKDFPFKTIDDISSIYDLLKVKKYDLIKRLLK